MEACYPEICPHHSAPPQPMQNCCQQCCTMALQGSPSCSLMPPAFAAPSCYSLSAPSFHCLQHHDGPTHDGCCAQPHTAFPPPCCAHEAANPATTAQHCEAAYYPRVAPHRWPAPSPYAMGFPPSSQFEDTRKKRHRKRPRRASPPARPRTRQNDDSVSGDASAAQEKRMARHKKVRIVKGPSPYAVFESVELSDQLEAENEPKNCSLLPLVLVAIVAAIVLIASAGHVAKSLYAEFPPGGAIFYKSITGVGGDPIRARYALHPGECSSESCRWQSQYIAQKLNRSVSPCVDFYSYVCSRNWFRKPDASSQPYTYSAHASTMQNLWDFLERVSAEGSTSFISEAALFMQNCVPGSDEDTDWDVLRKILKTLGIGEWPYGDAPPHAEAHSVAATAEKMLSVSSLVSVSLRARPSSHKTMLHVNSPPVLLRRYKQAFPGRNIKSYGEFIFKVLSLLNPGGQDVQQVVLRILMLEEKISTAAAQSVRNVPVADVTLPMANLTSQQYWDWQAYFRYFIREHEGRLTRDKVALLDSAYFNDLQSIISRFTIQTILNYVGYKLIVSISPLLPPDKAEFMLPLSYHPHLAGGVPKRIEGCFSLLERLYPQSTRALVWSQVLKKASTVLSRGFVDGLQKMERIARQEMKQAAAKAPWMGQQEAAEAVLKMERVEVILMEKDSNGTLHRRHPRSPLFKNLSLIEAYYNLLRARRAEYWRGGSTGQFHEPLLESDSAFETGFIYEPDRNEVLVSPATVQFISTISQRLDAVSVPFFLGEVLRGMFSSMSILGSAVDADGDLRQWWTSATKERFIKRAKCFQNSFADAAILYVKEGLRDESLFMEDNVVDGAVLRPLYNVHERLAKDSHKGNFIAGLPKNIDANKLFFINWASTFCEPQQDETALRERLRFKLSVPPSIRLNAALSRFPPFSDAFSCPAGSAMNQSKDCSFW